MRKTLAVLLACGLPLLGGWDWLTSPDRDVEEGNRLFEEGKYREALESFRKAEDGGGDPARLQYDLGTAYYKLAESLPEGEAKRDELFEKAELAFRRGAESQDPVLKSSSYYNAGNALFQRGEYREAIRSYRKALRANPENDQARYNLELALRKVERQPKKRRRSQKKKQKQGGGQKRKDQEGQGGQGQDQKPRRPEGQQSPGAGDRSNEKPGGGSSEQKQRGQSGSESEPRSKSKPEPPRQGGRPERPKDAPEVPPARPDWGGEPGAEGTPRSEAERKLDALERRSRQLRKRKLRRQSRRSRGHRRLEPKKDW